MSLERLFARVMNIPIGEIDGAARRRDFGAWNSVTHIELVTALEKTFGVSFTIDDVIAMDSLSAVRERLRRKGIEA
ncbi:MAG: acyl carrier protein [Elusimicrobiota bacterium]